MFHTAVNGARSSAVSRPSSGLTDVTLQINIPKLATRITAQHPESTALAIRYAGSLVNGLLHWYPLKRNIALNSLSVASQLHSMSPAVKSHFLIVLLKYLATVESKYVAYIAPPLPTTLSARRKPICQLQMAKVQSKACY